MVGYVNATIGIVLITFVYAYNLHSLLRSAAIVQDMVGTENLSFAEIVKYAFERGRLNLTCWAPYMYQLMNVLFVVTWAGELSFSIVFLADSLQNLLHAWGNAFNIHLVIIVLLIPCALLTLIPCEKLSCLSAVTSFIYISSIFVVLYDLYYNFDPSRLAKCEAMRPLHNVPQFLATIFFTLNFTGLAIPSRNLMKKPEKFNSIFGVMHASLLIITCANVLFGFSGYLRYGDQVQESLILNLSFSSPFMQAMLALYCLATYFSYPFLYFVLFNIVWKEWVVKLCVRERTMSDKSILAKYVTAIFTNIVVFGLVLVVPNLRLFTDLGGLVCGVMDSFVVPAVLQILLLKNWNLRFWFIVIKNCVIIAIGFVLFGFGLKACVYTSENSDSSANHNFLF
jgi:proton-coupled amino acid transporter